MLHYITSLLILTVVASPMLSSANTLTVNAEETIVPIGKLVAINQQKDKCYDKKPGGGVVEVKCPDVIVAKPKPSSGRAGLTTALVAQKVQAREFVPRNQIRTLGTQVALGNGTYNCYNEDPPGKFNPVRCPDLVVLETDK